MKPILFNTEMVRSILDGNKTQTRRLIKTPECFNHEIDLRLRINADNTRTAFVSFVDDMGKCKTIFAPYCKNDVLYVREKLYRTYYQAFDEETYYAADYFGKPDWVARVVPSIHMPKEEARIFLRVTDVRVELLREITNDDALAEGAKGGTFMYGDEYPVDVEPRQDFAQIWDETIKPQDRDRFGWDANPLVWVICFERISKEAADE